MWNKDTKFKITNQLPANQIGDDYILLDAKATKTHELNEIGKIIWTQLQSPKSIKELSTSLQDTFDIDRETLENDITDFVGKLEQLKLISIDE
ncbi:PqqD family protein [Halobacteriovorax sp. HLS]|uniref:PqqD family protein n=1 Tax=Halobacteriovorax sp. HLS TaxID=2234000 RepID=UPI000FDC51E3|nr:PqqD family protein [Halobacteriovorax sp. HLS]